MAEDQFRHLSEFAMNLFIYSGRNYCMIAALIEICG